jgi:hypothetical protein
MTDHSLAEQTVDRERISSFPAPIPKMNLAAQHRAPVVRIRELAALLLLVVLGDLTLYRGAGYAGLAVFTLGAPMVLLLGSPQPKLFASFWLQIGLLLLVALRIAWLGSPLAVAVAVVLVLGYSLALHGARPYLSAIFVRGLETTVAGGFALIEYGRSLRGLAPRLPRIFWLNILLPLAALGLFGTLFVLANPDLVVSLRQFAESIATQVEAWMAQFSSNVVEVVVWLVIAWIGAGLIRPLALSLPGIPQQPQPSAIPARRPEISAYYAAVRNTLWGVIGLFAVYLVFEFVTLWFRKFPQGFYYAGYAHQGAAWLTAALALATLVLSLIFRGNLLHDPRSGRLRILAWIWSAENLVLALTVFNRMYIYIDFNGLTRMRMVGLFGISTVVVGFGLVVWKIVHNRDFPWLVQRQLWALAGAAYLFVLAPIDVVVHSYNVRQILAGDLAPSVQISVHPISAEGYLVLEPLTGCEDVIIRDGIRAMLAERYLQQQQLQTERETLGWTAWQMSDKLLLGALQETKPQWQPFLDNSIRAAALREFRDYAYQWY